MSTEPVYDIIVVTGQGSKDLDQLRSTRDLIIALLPGATLGNVKIVRRIDASGQAYLCEPNPDLQTDLKTVSNDGSSQSISVQSPAKSDPDSVQISV